MPKVSTFTQAGSFAGGDLVPYLRKVGDVYEQSLISAAHVVGGSGDISIQAYNLAVTGTNTANSAESIALSAQSIASPAFSIAVAGTNAAATAQSRANAAYTLAMVGTNTGTAAYTRATQNQQRLATGYSGTVSFTIDTNEYFFVNGLLTDIQPL